MTDLVQWTLDTLDTNWNTTTYTKPALIDRRDGDRVNSTERSVSVDLSEGNAIGVGPGPDRENTPAGTYDNARVDDAVTVRIEGVHEDEWGSIASAADFQDLVDEAKRTLWVERANPVADYHTLVIETESDLSDRHKNYYRTDLTVGFVGYDPLP